MMSDLTVSEKRLLAALKRIEDSIDRAASQLGGQDEAKGADATTLELAAAYQRLSEVGQEVAQLAEANDALIEANRLLLERLDAGGSGADEVALALEAELHAMRALRATEEAQMAEILDRLDRVTDQMARDGGEGDGYQERDIDHG